ncbi:MAG: folylpolyglutamate synthase/dihydrofolate synthase family protein [Flavobacteriaceae bacterium]
MSSIKTYQEALSFLYARLPMFQRDGKAALNLKLDRIEALMEYLGNPHKRFKSIHVAGTNGKGSVSHSIASVLQEAGYHTGLYTSPHLRDFRERIRLSGALLPESQVVDFVNIHHSYIETHRLSFFELTVAMAFEAFASENVDVAVIEVGMGGRLDATNVITPELSVITNIGFDHMEFLGDTLEKIAAEKAGIIKPGITVVVGEHQSETLPVFSHIADGAGAPLLTSWNHEEAIALSREIDYDLKGVYQASNRLTALTALLKLRELGWFISDDHLKSGLSRVVLNTGLKGRWHWLNLNTVCDTAHNQAGLTQVMNQLRSLKYEQLHIVIGVVADKDLSLILPLFIKEAIYYFVKPDVPRGLDAHVLAAKALEYGLNGEVYDTVSIGLSAAQLVATEQDLVFVGGSTFTVAEVV